MDPIEVIEIPTELEETPEAVSRRQAIEVLHLLRLVMGNRNLSNDLRKQAFSDYLDCGG